MARRGKQRLMDDDFSSSGSEDSDAGLNDLSGDERAEALQNDPSARFKLNKKRKRNGKHDALYGVFAGETEDQDDQSAGSSKRYHKLPTFVSSSSEATADAARQQEEEQQVDNLAVPEEAAPTLTASTSKAASPQSEEDDMEESEHSSSSDDEPDGDAGEPLEQGHAGLGSTPNMPQSFGQQQQQKEPPQPKRSFLPAKPAASFLPKPQANLTTDEKRHFAKLETSGGIGFKMLSKMGWSTGTGLGSGGAGRVNPVDSQQRPVNMGIGYQGFKEKTKQSVTEAKRRGEKVSDDEDEEKQANKKRGKGSKKAGGDQAPKEKAWKAPKPKKPQVKHMTYEEILAQQSDGRMDAPGVDQGLGQIIDISGAELPSLPASLSANVPVPTSDSTRLPELRHNVRLIAEGAKSELDALAKEGNVVQQKQQRIQAEQKKAQAMLDLEQKRVKNLQDILSTVHTLSGLSSSLAKKGATPPEAFALFSDHFKHLSEMDEFRSYRLDEPVVAAIAPILRTAWRQWDVLDEPEKGGLHELKQWQKALRSADDQHQAPSSADDFYFSKPRDHEREMTPYEALVWSDWLPRVRSALNNSWSVTDAQPAIRLFIAWSPVLPPFVRDNMLDQLILPKISRTLSDWTPKSKYPLHAVVLPWLEHAGARMGDLLDEAKRALKTWFRGWRVKDGIMPGLELWQDTYSREEWSELLLKYILPVLGGHLHNHFQVNPREQKLEPLLAVLAWKPYLRTSMLNQLLEAEVLPKWLDTLWVWLTAPKPNFAEVSQWYSWWKDWFAQQGVGDLSSVQHGMAQGLTMMNSALDLGEDAQYRLARPSTKGLAESKPAQQKANAKAKSKSTPQQGNDISFRDLVEEEAAAADLLFLPANKSHPSNGLPLFRISNATSKKSGGLLVFIKDDVIWAQDDEDDWSPVGVSELIARAHKA